MLKPILVSILLIARLGCAQSCTPNATRDAASRFLAVQKQLLAIPAPEMALDIPESVRPLLRDFKQTWIMAIDMALRCGHPEQSQLETDFAALFDADHPPRTFDQERAMKNGDEAAGEFGDDLSVRVKPVPSQPDLFSIQLTYAISCGTDNILLLYRRSTAGYQRELVYESPDLKSNSDAIGDFIQFAAVPSNTTYPYLLAVAHGTAWCTSIHSLFHVDLLAPAVAGRPQRILAHEAFNYDRDDYEFVFKPTKDGFEIRADVTSIDFDHIFARPEVFRFRTTAGKLDRIQPIALNARDFVDAWLQTPWPQAKWLTAAEEDPLGPWRKRISDSTGVYDFSQVTLGPVRACSNDKTHFQVQVDLQKKLPGPSKVVEVPTGPIQSLYAQVHLSGNICLMQAMTPAPNPSCTGPNLMRSTK